MFSDLLGLPYESGANGPDKYDCWYLCVEVCKRMGINLPEVNISYTSILTISRTIKNETENTNTWEKIKIPEQGCVVAMTHHVGTVLSRTAFIHVRKDIPVCIEKLNSPVWKSKIKGFYKYVG